MSSKNLNNLNIKDRTVKNVLNTILHYKMISSGDSVLISISGGPDSVFLTSILNLIKDDFKLKLYCFHLDHKTRKGQSKKDAEFVEEFCRKLGIKLFKEEVDAKKWCAENKLSFQEGARKLRRSFLENIACANKIKKIAVGHNSDDNVETFFINLLRGSGLKGLTAIRPADGKFIRPLIDTSRDEILAALEKHGISYCKDRTNVENIYLRNKIRNLLIPFIRKNLSENFEKKLKDTIKIVSDENNLLSSIAVKTLKRIAVFKKGTPQKHIESIEIPIKKLKAFPDVLKKRVIIAAIEKFKGNLENIKSANIDDALKTCFSGGERKELSFTDNIKFVKEADKIYLIYSSGSKDIASISIIKEYDMVKEYDMLPGKEQEFSRLGIRCISEIIDGGIDNIKKESISCSEAYVDFDKIIFPVKVRTWIKNGGEKFYPLGAFGSKKLHDFFIDKKVPLSFRNKVSLFLDCEKIIWIGKYIIDERVKVDLNTRRILHIKIFDI